MESCFRSQEKGLDFRESALKGTGEVTASIVASTITTVVVYAPIAVVEGMIGQLFRGLCITIIFAMLTSLIVSLTFIPLFFTFFKPTEKKNAPAVKIMEAVSKRYARAVRAIIPRRVIVVLVVIGLVGTSVLMDLRLNRELDEDVDRGEFSVEARSRAGTTQDNTDKSVVKYEEALLADPDIKDVYYNVRDNVASITAIIDKASGKTTNEKVDEYNRLWSKESGMDLSIAAAVFLIFLVMAMQFESPRFSLMVMMSIPFSLICSIGLLFITRSSLTANALLGVLMLVGIVVKINKQNNTDRS